MSNKAQGGFTLIEAIVAITVFVVSVAGMIQLTLVARSSSDQGRDVTQASNYLQEGVEAVRSIRDAGWANITAITSETDYRLTPQSATPPWVLSPGSEAISGTKFTRTLRFSDVRRSEDDGNVALSSGDNICIGTGCGAYDDPDTRRVTVTVSWQQGTRTVSRQIYAYITNWQ